MNMIATASSWSEATSGELEPRQAAAVAALREQIAKVNAAVAMAVDTGLTIELVRSSRHHSGQSTWGDQMSPKVMPAG